MHLRDALRLTGIFSIALVFGLILDAVLVFLLVAAFGYIAWLHLELERMLSWVRNRKAFEPPEHPGVFEEIALEVDYLRERHKKRKKKLANYLKQFQQATRALPDATIVLDRNDEIRWANAAARRDLGIRWPEDVGQRVTNLVRLPELRAIIEQGEPSGSIRVTAPAEPDRHLSVLVAPYGSSQRLLVARDVSELHRANQIRSDFVANVSHELRTPITVFRGYVENLLGRSDEAPAGWGGALEQMQAHADRMQKLVEELLLLSKLEQEERVPNPAPVDVAALIADIHGRAAELSGDRDHLFSLEVDPSVKLLGAADELDSAFSNIVYNAVKYTRERGVIRIRWRADEDGGARFEVEDNGIGIAPEHLPRLTERFYRVDTSRARSRGGTGLGLAIVKHVLSRHGGRLEIESAPGEGSTFRCAFPAEAIVTQNGADDGAQARSSGF